MIESFRIWSTRNDLWLMRVVVLIFTFLVFQVAGQNCNNINFESTPVGSYTSANAVTGWSVSSQTATNCNANNWVPGSNEFSLVPTVVSGVPVINYLGHSPFGGTVVAQLNSTVANASITRLTYTINSVTNNSRGIGIAYAGFFQNGNHLCCEQAKMEISVKVSGNTVYTCQPIKLNAEGTSCSSAQTFTQSSGCTWTNWKTQYFDLGEYSGMSVELEIIASDCTHGDHFGTVFFDAICIPSTGGLSPNPPFFSMGKCPGSTGAVLSITGAIQNPIWQGPPGYPVPPSQASLSVITVSNGVIGNPYTVYVENFSGCRYQLIDTLVQSKLGYCTIIDEYSCTGGTSGAVHASPIGVFASCQYVWQNSLGDTVSNQYSAANLAPGIYSLSVFSSNAGTCALLTQTINLLNIPVNVKNRLRPYCGTVAYFNDVGSDHQWYLNSVLINPAVANSITLSPVTTTDVIIHTLTNPYGCRDSIIYHPYQIAPGSITTPSTAIKPSCPNSSHGQMVVNLSPSSGATPQFTFSIISANYTYTNTFAVSPSHTLAGLGVGTYSINAFDGSCFYSHTVNVPSYDYDYTVKFINTNGPTTTLCPGQAAPTILSFTNSSNYNYGYTYTWSPTTWIPGAAPNQPMPIFVPTNIPVGGVVTNIYTITITPNYLFCPISKTISITAVSPPTTPTLMPVPALCQYGPAYALQSIPTGGIYSNNALNGNVNTSLSAGIHTYSYSIDFHSCPMSSQSQFTLLPAPQITVSGVKPVCPGSVISLSATGADFYQWSGGQSGPIASFSPSSYTLVQITSTSAVNQCTNSVMLPIHVVQAPTISVTGNTKVCEGNTVTLYAGGASSYTWTSNGTGSMMSFVTPGPTTVSVIGANDNDCTTEKKIAISTIAYPTPFFLGRTTICKGEPAALIGAGAETFAWNNTPGVALNHTPQATSQYTLYGTNGGICTSSIVAKVTVNACTGIQSNENEIFSVSPNPFENRVTIHVIQDGNLEITDATGRTMFTRQLSKGKHEIEFDYVACGIYYARFGQEIRKLVKRCD